MLVQLDSRIQLEIQEKTEKLKDATREHIICVVLNKYHLEEFYITYSFASEGSVVHISKVGQFVMQKRHFSQMCFLTDGASRNQTRVGALDKTKSSPVTTESRLTVRIYK